VRVAFRAVAVVFALTTIFVLVLFVRALGHQEIRSGLFTYAIFTSIAAVGLWLERGWGRGFAIAISLGNSALGALATIAYFVDRRGQIVGPVILFVLSTLLTYLLTRPIFYPREP
jgi:hypothetical protein